MEEECRNEEEEEKKEHSPKKKNKKKKERKKNKSDENVWLCAEMISRVDDVKFDLSDDLMSKEFVEFVYNEGVDINLMDSEKVKDLKRKYGEVEICRSKYEYKQAKLSTKLEKLKSQHYQRALQKFS